MVVEGNGDPLVPDLRTIEELCQPSLNGRGGPIAPIAIQATNFGLKNDMIQQVQNSFQFHGLPGDDTNKHLDKFLHVTQSIKVNRVTDDALRLYLFPHFLTHHATTWFDHLPRNSINTFEQMAKMFLGKYFPPSMVTKLRNEITKFRQRPDESLFEAWERYKLSIDRCPNHNMLRVTQIDTFYNGLTLRHRDTINAAVGETFMKRRPEECYDLIENMTAHHNYWDTSAQRSESSSFITSSSDQEIVVLKAEMAEINKSLMRVLQLLHIVKLVVVLIPTMIVQPPLAKPRTYMLREPIKVETVPPTINESTKDIQPLVVQIETPIPNSEPVVAPVIEPVAAPVSAQKPNPKPSIPYPSRFHDQKLRDKANDQKEKIFKIFQDLNFNISFADALILMPKFGPTIKTLLTNKDKLYELARTSLNEHCSTVILKKLPEKLGDPVKFLIPCDFLGMDECLALADLGPSINLMPLSVWNKLSLPQLTPTLMTLELSDWSISRPIGVAEDVYVKVGKFHFPADFVVVDFDADPRVPLILGRSFLKTERALIDVFEEELNLRGHLLLEAFLNDDPSLPPPNQGNYLPQVRKELKICEAKNDKSSIDVPLEVELKDLPPHLEYVFLEGYDNGLAPKKGQSKIHNVIKKEVPKLLDAGLIYPISDCPWVSPVHCVSKKGGFTVVENEENELILTQLVTGWRVCIDCQKLNEATRKDQFPLPFMDQMLERLAGNEYYCFLDGFSGYFQILIDPKDQEKTTFTCSYDTFAYRRMPFGLCNAPGMFQRCMMAIFYYMIEKMMEVFMNDFSVSGNSFGTCLSHLEKMLQ
nr:reverse transcriptase domain-containing protein [Tanacetum cinerariifolium]